LLIHHGDCLEVLRTLPENSIDSMVTDPPAGIGFMGKEWDSAKGGRKEWCAWMDSVMRECLRVMKPGAHGLVWALPRTSHWTATALEDAGFEIRDCVYHLFGSGFPKSLDVSKAIDKAEGAKRKVLYVDQSIARKNGRQGGSLGKQSGQTGEITAPATDAAKQWQGFGTALKPAVECWWLVRKPCSEKTVAANVLKWGTGALNIDGSRIESVRPAAKYSQPVMNGGQFNAERDKRRIAETPENLGRFPSHLLLSHTLFCVDGQVCADDCPVAMLDEQSGVSKSTGGLTKKFTSDNGIYGKFNDKLRANAGGLGDSGGASRFFYCAKVSSSERNAGFEGSTETKRRSDARPNSGDQTGKFPDHDHRERTGNFHPTVKPQKLMRYLARLVTPPKGVILDPFMGSGSTGLAAKSEGFGFVGIEREAEYFEISKKRMNV
jgi:hypothetical protein